MVQSINSKTINKTTTLEQQNNNSKTNAYKSIAEKSAENISTQSNDTQKVSYKITDSASETNEAQQEVDEAKKSGKKLNDILQDLIPKAQSKNEEMAKIQEELSQYEVEMQDYIMSNMDLEDTTQEEIKNAAAEAENCKKQADKVQDEIKEKQKTIQNSDNSTADSSDKENTQSEIDALKTKYEKITSRMDQISTYTNKEIKQVASAKAEKLGKSMADVKDMAEAHLNSAINANEYADVTIEKGLEAAKIDNWKDALKEGFTYKSNDDNNTKSSKNHSASSSLLKNNLRSINIITKSKELANQTGSQAVALGEQLGNSTKTVSEKIKSIGQQYGISTSNTGINNLINKEYVDTSKMADVKEFEDDKNGYDLRAKINNAKIMVSNQQIYDDITKEVKDKEKNKTQS